jgi:cytidine deaminase
MTEHGLVQTALKARETAYAPYSNFPVGAALECEDGTVFCGCNVENAAFGSTICAERTAVLKAVSEGHRRFRRLAIAGSSGDPCWPCGACRQVLSEFAPALTLLISDGEGRYVTTDLGALLPHSFGAETLDK